MSKNLVTGASGFTGGAICRRLIQEGEEVVAFVRSTSKAADLVKIGVECRVVDIKSWPDVQKNFFNIKKVYHIAAAYRGEHVSREEFRLVNLEATRNLLNAAREAGVERFIHCSTVGVQGTIEEPPADEEYRFKPHDHYQESKLAGELVAREYFANGLTGTVVRPGAIYGPGDTRFLKLFRSIDRGFFVMIGSGRNLYHLTYIDDLVEGFMLAGKRQEAVGEVFTIAGENYVTTRELVNTVAETLGKPHPKLRIPMAPVYVAAVLCDRVCRPLGIKPPIYPRRLDFFSKDRAFSIAKAKRLLGYQPKVDLQEGFRKTANWYRESGLI